MSNYKYLVVSFGSNDINIIRTKPEILAIMKFYNIKSDSKENLIKFSIINKF